MFSLCLLTISSCLLSLLLTPVMRNWSVRVGLVDRPDHRRKIHSAATPRTGGVPILISYMGAYALLLLLPLDASGQIGNKLGMVWHLLPPVALVFLTGLLDDWLDLRPWQKLLGELAAAAWAWFAGVRILGIAGLQASAPVGFLLTVGWLILCANAFNLIDGVDGLAAGVGLTATMTTFIAGVLHGDTMLGLATAPLIGALVGFLRYNFNPASIFLGDSGSLSIGFLLGAYGVIWSQKSATMLGVAAPAMALALPLLEVALSIIRRFLRNEPIFTGDRGHIHHRLLDRGFTPRRVALLLYAACGFGAALSLLQSIVQNRFAGVVIVLFGVVTWIGVQYLGYAEFEATCQFLWQGFRPLLGAYVRLRVLEQSLIEAASVEQCWTAMETAARSLGYSHVVARLGGGQFATAAEHLKEGAFWQMRLALPNNDYVNITQHRESVGQPVLLIQYIETVRRLLPRKLTDLSVSENQRSACPAGAALASLSTALNADRHSPLSPRNSNTRTVRSSDCAAPSVNAATAS